MKFYHQKSRPKLKPIEDMSLTTDIWTDIINTKSYIGLTGHFIDQRKLKSIVFGVRKLDHNHTSEYISQILKEMCDEWGIKPNKIPVIVTDNAANIVKAVKDTFGENKHLPCFAHTLNLVASKPFQEKNGDEDIRNAVDIVKNIVRYFKQSVVAADELRKAQKDTTPLKLIQSVPTRWNSIFYQLERFVRLADKVAPILLGNAKAPPMLTAAQLESIKDLLEILKPFENLTKELCGLKYVTISTSIPLINCLKDDLQSMNPRTVIGKKAIRVFLREIDVKFNNIEFHRILSESTILDPRFKRMHFTVPQAIVKAVGYIKSQLADLTMVTNQVVDNTETSGTQQTCPDQSPPDYGIWRSHGKKLHQELGKVPDATTSQVVGTEFQYYLSQPPHLFDGCDPIEYWSGFNKNNDMYGKLSMLTLKRFCIVATSVPCERLYSVAGNVVTLIGIDCRVPTSNNCCS